MKRVKRHYQLYGVAVVGLMSGCLYPRMSDIPDDAGSQQAGAGGAIATGGIKGTGGSKKTGGAPNAGGSNAVGGNSSIAGAPNSGGSNAGGGNTSTGGGTNKGGSGGVGTGGTSVRSAGGSAGLGGTLGNAGGGMTSTIGNSCASMSQCSSGLYCVDGVCCDQSCNDKICQRCDSNSSAGKGHCGYNLMQTDPDGECPASAVTCGSVSAGGTSSAGGSSATGGNRATGGSPVTGGASGNSDKCTITTISNLCSGTGYACAAHYAATNIPSGYVCVSNSVAVVNKANYCNSSNDCAEGACSASRWSRSRSTRYACRS